MLGWRFEHPPKNFVAQFVCHGYPEMLAAAVTKARMRLGKANSALEAIRNATTFEEFESAWTDYLLAYNSIFTVLEKGAKSAQKSEHWFAQKKGERRNDPLLAYLRQARNADEHGINSVAERRLDGGITFGDQPAGPGRKITRVTFRPAGGKEIVAAHDENGLSNITVLRPVTVLLKVFDDRSNKWFQPPTEHLGRLLTNPNPIGVAETALAYVTSLIQEAETYSQ